MIVTGVGYLCRQTVVFYNFYNLDYKPQVFSNLVSSTVENGQALCPIYNHVVLDFKHFVIGKSHASANERYAIMIQWKEQMLRSIVYSLLYITIYLGPTQI